MRKSVKYLHIFTHHNSTHNGSIIDMINDITLPFKPSEHLFVMAKKSSYENFKHYNNVILNENIVDKNMKEFNDYAKHSNYIFLHRNNMSCFQIYRINKNFLNKIIWCVWGEGYLYPPDFNVQGLYRKIRRTGGLILRYLASMRIKKFYAIGIGFNYDAIAVRKRFGGIRILATPYGYIKDRKKMYDKTVNICSKIEKQAPSKIMIGHSAYPHLQHKKIMDMLYKFREENILISLVLSYGDMEYAKEIEEYAVKMFPNVEVIKDYMSPEDYLRYLNTVDVWILDYTGQNALGNFYQLLYLGKKIYLNDKSIMMLAARLEVLEIYNVIDINYMNFFEFIAPLKDSTNNRKYAEFIIDENNDVLKWVNTLQGLK